MCGPGGQHAPERRRVLRHSVFKGTQDGGERCCHVQERKNGTAALDRPLRRVSRFLSRPGDREDRRSPS